MIETTELVKKISGDRYYNKLYKEFDIKFIEEAGFFEDTLESRINFQDTLDVMCTPINFINNKSSSSKKSGSYYYWFICTDS